MSVESKIRTKTNRGVKFLVDSGATINLINDLNLLSDVRSCSCKIKVADNRYITARKVGLLKVYMKNNRSLILHQVYFHPECANLLSVGRLASAGYTLDFKRSELTIIKPNGKVLCRVPTEEDYKWTLKAKT